MTCKKCGASLAANANFCHHCGEKQEAPTWQQLVYGTPTAPQPTDGTPDGGASTGAPQTPPAPTAQSPSATQPSPAPSYPAPYPYNPYNPYNPYSRVSPFDAPNIGYAILCFFFPIVGLILYLVWKDEFPRRAKSAGKGALIGVITSVVLSIIFVAIYIGLIFWLIGDAMYYY